jgi:hypothetical protein
LGRGTATGAQCSFQRLCRPIDRVAGVEVEKVAGRHCVEPLVPGATASVAGGGRGWTVSTRTPRAERSGVWWMRFDIPDSADAF